MAPSEQYKLLQQSFDDFCRADFDAYANNFTEDFRRETLPQGKVPQYGEKSRAELLTSMQGFRSTFTTAFKMEITDYVEQPGSLMAFIHATCTTVWNEPFETDLVILANFVTEEDGKLRISYHKQFMDGFYLTKMAESLKANGFPAPGA